MDSKKDNNQQTPNMPYLPIGMCFGISIGVAIGSALGHIGVGMCFGVAIGVGFGAAMDHMNRKKAESNSGEDKPVE